MSVPPTPKTQPTSIRRRRSTRADCGWVAWPRPPWAALVALVGVLIARGLFDVPLLAPTSEGTLGDASTAGLAGLAAAAALLATGLMHLLLVSTPRPGQFFSWIMVLATLIAAIVPFMTDAEQNTKITTAAIYVAIGATIASLISSVARSAVRVRPANPPMAGS